MILLQNTEEKKTMTNTFARKTFIEAFRSMSVGAVMLMQATSAARSQDITAVGGPVSFNQVELTCDASGHIESGKWVATPSESIGLPKIDIEFKNSQINTNFRPGFPNPTPNRVAAAKLFLLSVGRRAVEHADEECWTKRQTTPLAARGRVRSDLRLEG
jgi:hypothetical protein